MALSSLDLCNRALARLGARPITAFNDGSTEADICNLLYAPVRDAVLSAYGWSFATAQVNLTTPITPPIADYTVAFNLPADFLRALSLGAAGRGRGIPFRILGKVLHTDVSPVTFTYIFRPNEADWPAYFDMLIIQRLSAELCIPLTENTARAENLLRMAELEFTRVRQIDAQQDTPQRIEDFSLINARG
jgi:hypothetical protein